MTYSLRMSTANFWINANAFVGRLRVSDSLHMILLQSSARMSVIRRNTTEYFTHAAPRLAGSARVIINGNFYALTRSGQWSAVTGSDPVDPAETTSLGRLVDNEVAIGGVVSRQMFNFAQVRRSQTPGPLLRPEPLPCVAPLTTCPDSYAYEYQANFGPAPTGAWVQSAIGGLGPLVIQGLKYGNGNRYRAGAPGSPPATGAPPANAQPFLTQRNNNTFISAAGRSVSTGKTILASSSEKEKILIIVQEDGSSGQRLDHIRDRLFDLSFDNAVFLDGSDSSCLWFGGSWRIRPGNSKNETINSGVAFH